MMLCCCSECFADEWLRGMVTRKASPLYTCDFCGADEVAVIQVEHLAPLFTRFLEMYEPSQVGLPLAELIQRDWGVFNQTRLSFLKQSLLLAMILGANRADREIDFQPAQKYQHHLGITYMDRGVPEPNGEGYDNIVEELAPVLRHGRSKLMKGQVLYRARAGYQVPRGGYRRAPFRRQDIGAPPADRAPAGRANRPGEPVLYCAMEESTAIAELRQARGAWLSVCILTVSRDIPIIDLATLRRPNPFTSSSVLASYIAWQRCKYFAEEMSTPLERNDDPRIYKSCQSLADAVRRCGYIGICYPSALAPGGTNVVLFDPSVVEIGESLLVKITSVSTTHEHIQNENLVIDPVAAAIEEALPRLNRP
jgi:RES domain-containing protein